MEVYTNLTYICTNKETKTNIMKFEKGNILELKNEYKDSIDEPKYLVIEDRGNKVLVEPIGYDFFITPQESIKKEYFK